MNRTERNRMELIENGNLELVTWTVSRKIYTEEKFQENLPSLVKMSEGQVQPLTK